MITLDILENKNPHTPQISFWMVNLVQEIAHVWKETKNAYSLKKDLGISESRVVAMLHRTEKTWRGFITIASKPSDKNAKYKNAKLLNIQTGILPEKPWVKLMQMSAPEYTWIYV